MTSTPESERALPAPSYVASAFTRELHDGFTSLCHLVSEAGGRAWLVGGCVRDALLREKSKDVDIEVFGLSEDRLESVLDVWGAWNPVGKSYGVYKLKHAPIDVSLPRRERKTGPGHKAFAVETDPSATLEQAARRRDFTLNALLWDPLQNELADPLGGRADLEGRVLRHCGPQFSEDPLRVLRGMQFVARFALDPLPDTVALCRDIEPEGLAPERVFEEWKKLLLKGTQISRGLEFLRATGWVRFYPELEALIGCPQDPKWHPEGDVWTHTGHCLDAFARERTGEEWEDLVVGCAVLCHDMGKPSTTELRDGRIRSIGHTEEGEAAARSFLERLTRQKQLIEEVLPLVREHHRPTELFHNRASNAAIRRLAGRVGRIDRLLRVVRADQAGRPPLPPGDFPEGRWLLDKARQLEVEKSAPRPLIQGRHLIELGLEPSPRFGTILSACFEAQLDGVFSDETGGLEYLRTYLGERS